jgi:hypothetical protein
MKHISWSALAVPTASTLVKSGLLVGVLMVLAPNVVLGMEKKGTTPYVTHFIFRPVQSMDIPGLGSATALEAVGTTENMKGEKTFDKMSAHCTALSVASGDKKYIDGACVLADSDGDKIFSTFDTRDVTNRRLISLVALTSSRAARVNTKGSLGESHLLVTQCLRLPALVAIPPWTSRTTQHGRSSNRALRTGLCDRQWRGHSDPPGCPLHLMAA